MISSHSPGIHVPILAEKLNLDFPKRKEIVNAETLAIGKYFAPGISFTQIDLPFV